MWHTVVLCVVLMLGLRSALANSWEDCNKGGDRDQVIRACTEIITRGETGPKLALAYNNRCAAYREASYDEEDLEEKALADCDKAIELDPKLPTAYSNRCWVYIGKNELDRALADCDKAIELDPKFASAYAYRCGVYADKNEDYSRALDDCNKAIELDPRLASAYASRGRIYGEKKDYDRALADDDKAIELDPKSVRAAVTYGNRGWVYAQKGYLDKAIANYDTAIELRPNFAAHYNQRCWFRAIDPHVQQSQLQRALADCNEALRLKHNAFDSRGVRHCRGVRGLWCKVIFLTPDEFRYGSFCAGNLDAWNLDTGHAPNSPSIALNKGAAPIGATCHRYRSVRAARIHVTRWDLCS